MPNFIGKCPAGTVTLVSEGEWQERATIISTKYGTTRCDCGCGRLIEWKPVRATVSRTECGPRCTSAMGPSCDCKCGGEHHAESHRMVNA